MGSVLAIIAAILAGVTLLLFYKFPKTKEVIPWVSWSLELVRITVYHWGFEQKYKSTTDLAARFFITAASISAGKSGLRDVRKEVSAIIEEAYQTLNPDRPLTDVERKMMTAAYVTAISYDEITEAMASVWETHADLDVRKTTLLAIDVLGELVVLEDELGQQYFQHLIYGINKSLKLIRDHGTDKRALKKVASTLFRVYKLSKAYRHRRKLGGHTEGEFYDKIVAIFEHMAVVVATK
jgi:hypothetical protein